MRWGSQGGTTRKGAWNKAMKPGKNPAHVLCFWTAAWPSVSSSGLTEFWSQRPFLGLPLNFSLVSFQWFLMEIGACRGRQRQLMQSNAQLWTVSCGFLCLAFTSVIKSLIFMNPPKNTHLFNNLRHLHSAYSYLGCHLFYLLERAGS